MLGDGTFFTAAEADQMRYVPELVFINCCFLGKTTGDAREHARYDRLAANLATQFIRMGARAVIAAGWEVDDGAAKTFATSFYRNILNGLLFGDAVMEARRATYTLHGDTNTWGAYQCYGDVSFSLKMGDVDQASTEFVSEAEFRLWVEGVPARARDTAQQAALLRELDARIAAAPEEWFESADMGCQGRRGVFRPGGIQEGARLLRAAVRRRGSERSHRRARTVRELPDQARRATVPSIQARSRTRSTFSTGPSAS